MTKNLIPEIVKMLGVELGEEFKIEGDNRTYWFDLDGLHSGEYVVEDEDDAMLHDLLCGEVEIIKLPWKPKKDEKYWGFWYSQLNEAWLVVLYTWSNNPDDFAFYKAGWVFHTKKEAEDALPKVAAEFDVKYRL